jgi:hypothetical protein
LVVKRNRDVLDWEIVIAISNVCIRRRFDFDNDKVGNAWQVDRIAGERRRRKRCKRLAGRERVALKLLLRRDRALGHGISKRRRDKVANKRRILKRTLLDCQILKVVNAACCRRLPQYARRRRVLHLKRGLDCIDAKHSTLLIRRGLPKDKRRHWNRHDSRNLDLKIVGQSNTAASGHCSQRDTRNVIYLLTIGACLCAGCAKRIARRVAKNDGKTSISDAIRRRCIGKRALG